MDKLLPFSPQAGSVSLSGLFTFAKGRVHVKFELRDPDREVIGSLERGTYDAATAVRTDELWRATCFEAFWGVPGEPGYWELNLAPSGGRWNVFHLEKYRVPQPPARSDDFTLERLSVRDGVMDCVLRTGLLLEKVEASLCAVLITAQGAQYYALTHAGAKADFHLRSSFCVRQGE